MKNILGIALIFFGTILLAPVDAVAQDRTVTIFLVRHAEKDMSDPEDGDPGLSEDGKDRAERLQRVLAPFRPNRILSTDTERTRSTVAPIASKRNLRVELYDPRKLADTAEFLRGLKKNRKVLVVGHSNTTAVLANLLFGSNTFNNLQDSEYDKLFIIRLKKGKIRVEVRTF
jgi:2,3-bisphosphoglycerate-dependent phosphoglycerate mutase